MAQTDSIGRTATNVNTFNGLTVVRYHATDVVKFSSDIIVLNSGGWQTATTKTRMNQTSNQFELGYRVYQKNFDWYVVFKGETLDFEDGMKLNRQDNSHYCITVINVDSILDHTTMMVRV